MPLFKMCTIDGEITFSCYLSIRKISSNEAIFGTKKSSGPELSKYKKNLFLDPLSSQTFKIISDSASLQSKTYLRLTLLGSLSLLLPFSKCEKSEHFLKKKFANIKFFSDVSMSR